MPCYRPLLAYYGPHGPTFDVRKSFGRKHPIELPCGNCIGCRLERARAWAIRCTHESQLSPFNAFLTLTYDDNHLPDDGSLKKSDFQDFIRALRKQTGEKIRYYMCGEYGSQCRKHEIKNCPECGPIQRPHYHALIFGYDFPDKTQFNVRDGNKIYRSKQLERLWYHGNSEIGDVTFQSAGYVARYVVKKVLGDLAAEHYAGKIPEYNNMSLKPGIGYEFYKKYKADIFPGDFVVLNGKKMPTPNYYRKILQKEDPALYEKLKNIRVKKAQLNEDNTPERLATREFCQTKKAERLIRDYL